MLRADYKTLHVKMKQYGILPGQMYVGYILVEYWGRHSLTWDCQTAFPIIIQNPPVASLLWRCGDSAISRPKLVWRLLPIRPPHPTDAKECIQLK